MASITQGLIQQVQIDTGNKQNVASTAYGVCSTSASEQNKTVEMTGFELITGTTVHIKFNNKNTATSPNLNINNTGNKPIVLYGTTAASSVDETTGWQPGAVISFTYDGTSWVRDQGYNTNTWRGIQDNLTSDSTTDSLSAKQGKALKGLIDAMDATTPNASGNATAFIDNITQTDGKITSITKKNIPTVSSSTAGLAPQGAAVSTQTTSTKFLREDGTWAAPSYTTNVDTKVAQTGNTENKEFSILLKNTNNTSDETTGVKFGKTENKLVTVNPSTGRITAPGGLAGKADSAIVADSANAVTWSNVSSKPTSIKLTGAVTGNVTLGSGENSIATTVNHTHSYLSSIAWDNSNKKITQSVNGAAATAILEFVAGSNITLTPAAGKLTIANSYSYTLPLATYSVLGGLKPAYSSTGAATLTTAAATNADTPAIAAKTTTLGRYYAVEADKNGIAYVNVPWTDHYAWADITSKPDTATRWPTWDEVTSKPSTFAPSAHNHSQIITVGDKRTEATTPNSYANQIIFQGLKNNSAIGSPYTDTYSYLVGLRGWADSSGGNSHELAFNTDGIYRRQGATTTWGTWLHLLDSNNTAAGTNNAATLAWNTTYTIAKINGTDIKFTTMAKPSYAFTDLTAHPTTLSGYGITDAKIASGVITLGSNTITPVTSVNGHTGSSVSVTAADLGLSKAMRFIGVATVAITDGSTTDPVISGYSTKTAGDVIIDKDSSREYVWSTTNKWELLGGDSSYKTTQSTVDSGAAATNKWVSRIEQNANGVVTATMGTLDTSGTWSGNAATATTATQLSFKNGRIASADLDISTMHSRMLLTLASSSMTTNKPPMGDGYIVTYGWDNAHWGAQQAISHTKTPHMAIRGTNGGSTNDWGNWIYLLDANNYTDYTVKKDGTGASGSWGISITGNAATATKLKDNASNTTGSFWRGDNTWSNTLLGPLKIGAPDVAANTGYASANVGSQNYIAFYGVYGDNPGSYNHTYIGESIYGSKTTANEQSELLLFHGNDPGSGSGPDRIRLFAGQIDICVYTAATSGTWDTIRQTAGTQVANFANGQVTITGNLLPEANNTRNLGSSSVKWANVYATTFTGNLTGNVTGNITGNVTGNLTGNVTGNVSGSSGSCTGNAATATKLASAVSINGTNFDGSANITTDNWGTARDITIGGTKKSVNGSQAYTWTNNEINRIQIGTQADHQRVVIGLCELSTTNTAICSNWHGKLYRVRNNGLVPDYFADVDFNAAYGTANAFFYSLITDYENTNSTIHIGEGYHACVFKYNNKYYGGLEFKQTQSSAFYADGVGEFTPFAVVYYNDNNSTIINSEIDSSITFSTSQCIRQQTCGSFKGILQGNADTASKATAANLTSVANTIPYFTDTAGTFGAYGGITVAGTAAANWKVTFNGTTDASSTTSASAVKIAGGLSVAKKLYADSVYGSVWNDYAEYRSSLINVPGACVIENDNGTLSIANDRLIPGASIISDTYGFSQGKTEQADTPIAVAGRVLAYPYLPREKYHAGMAVCSAPGGTVDIMTREEIRDYPDAIIGIVSEIPNYDTWGPNNIKVDNRIWIKVRY